MTLDELFEAYCRKRLRGASPRTLVLYRHSLKSFEATIGRKATVEDLTDDNLETHAWRLVNAGLSPYTANKDISQIGAIWRFGSQNKLVETWPNVRLLKTPERIPLGWTQDELERLMAAIEKTTGSICSAPARLWWRGLINLIMDCGERIGAVRQLQREHFHHTHILVPARLRKGNTRDRLYSLSEATQNDVSLLLTLTRSDLLFPWDKSPTLVYKHLTRILATAGLSTDYRSKFHRLRRTVASAVANCGGDPSAALDHSSPKVTKKYLDPRIVANTPTSVLVSEWRKKAIS